MACELSGAAALLLGIVRLYVALLLVPIILGTSITVHGRNGSMFCSNDGAWEFPAF